MRKGKETLTSACRESRDFETLTDFIENIQALTKGQFAPGVASAFACVFLLGGLGKGR